MITLRPMTDAEYDPYAAALLESYAESRAKNIGTTLDEERAASAKQIAELLPNGLHTPNHYFWRVVNEAGEPVGVLWVHVLPEQARAFIYDIEMGADQRGKGYGRATLEAMEAALKPLGVSNVGLSVFGDNAVAQRLYEKMGYEVVATNMKKAI